MDINEIIKSDIRASLTRSGLLLFLAGFFIFMGIITGEIFYTAEFTTRDNYISELSATIDPNTTFQKLSAAIFDYSMAAGGLMVLLATWYVHKIFKKYLMTFPMGILGIGIAGVGLFPGHIQPWHGILALMVFISGGVAAITSFKIVHTPLKYIFVAFGIIALVLLSFQKYFIPTLGVGGAERWLFYPVVFWITGMGTYLLGIKDGHKNTLNV
jgi:hypothetical membrane protein